MAVEPTGKEAREQLHRRSEERAEVQRMGDLRQPEQPDVFRPQSGGPPAQRGAEHGHGHHLARVPATEDPCRQEEHADFGQDADRPEQAEPGCRVAMLAQIDGEEGVIGAERNLGKEGGDEKGAHRRLAQSRAESGLIRCVGGARRMLVMVGVGRGQQPGQQWQHEPGQAVGAEAIEQRTIGRHHHDEADRAPDADLPVTVRLCRQMRQGDRFELRHDRVVGETESAHHHEQAGEIQRQQEGGEGEQGQPAAQVQPADRTRRARRQRGPGTGGDDARGVPQAHQHADRAHLHPARLQEQAPIRRECAQCRVIGEIEARQPRDRDGGGRGAAVGRRHGRFCTGACSSSRVPCASLRRCEMPRSRISEWVWCGRDES